MKRLSVLLATMVIAAAALDPRADTKQKAVGQQKPIENPRTDAETSQGCFESQGELKDASDLGVTYKASEVTSGKCKDYARAKKSPVFALKGEHCYLGDKYPPEDKLADDKKCNFGCPAYPDEACGGLKGGSYFSVFNTGLELDVPYSDEKPSESSGSGSKETDAADDGKNSSGSVNVAGVAAGTVVGVLAVAGAVGGTFFYMRRKRNNEIEEEHRRNAAVNSFIGGHSGSGSVTDARLDPIMAQRRMSDGSIADNQDYSRRILRVTNV